jgi:hypothetical protein
MLIFYYPQSEPFSIFMTTYLTKIEDGKTHHLRTTINGNGVDIVYGIIYNCIEKFWQPLDDIEAAAEFQRVFIEKKISEGYVPSPFQETVENTLEVYDKAKWHYQGNFPADLDSYQGFVHTGMFLGWLIENKLLNEGFIEDFSEEIRSFGRRERTGSRIFMDCCDGVLLLNDLSETGNRFALTYFELGNGQYMDDYERTLAADLPSAYHVADTWANYEILKPVLNDRFYDWKKSVNL